MARIQRYISDVEAELRSEQSSIMSPGQAAATEQAKFNAIGTGLQSMLDVSKAMAEVRDEEGLNSATAKYDSALASIDDSIDNMPPEVDEDGNITFTPGRLMKMQEGAYNSVSGAIREQIKSVAVRRVFDKMVLQDRSQRREEMQAKEFKAEATFMRQSALVEIADLTEQRKHDAAENRANQALASGAIDQIEHTNELGKIGMARDNNYVYEIINDPTTSPEDFRVAARYVIDGVHPGGTKFEMDFKERYQLRVAILTEQNRRMSPDNEAVKARQRSNYIEIDRMLRTRAEGAPGFVELGNMHADGGLDRTQFEELRSRINEPGYGLVAANERDVAIAKDIRYGLLNQYDGDMDKSLAAYRTTLYAMGMPVDKRDELVDGMQDRIDAVLSRPRTKNIIDIAFQSVTGYEEGALMDINGELFGRFNELVVVGRAFKDEVMKLAVQPQYRDDRDKLEAAVNEMAKVYKVRAVSSSLTVVGVPPEYLNSLEDVEPDVIMEIQGYMTTWLTSEDIQVGTQAYADRLQTMQDKINHINKIVPGLNIAIPVLDKRKELMQ